MAENKRLTRDNVRTNLVNIPKLKETAWIEDSQTYSFPVVSFYPYRCAHMFELT